LYLISYFSTENFYKVLWILGLLEIDILVLLRAILGLLMPILGLLIAILGLPIVICTGQWH
jgi:hypothetical protein